MDTFALAAFLCNAEGRLQALTPCAEALMASGRHLVLQDERLVAGGLGAPELSAALMACGGETRPPPCALILRDEDGGEPLLIEVAGLFHAQRGAASALILARRSRARDGRVGLLARALFGLTPSEVGVVTGLVAGLSPEEIAAEAGVTVGTVRSHIQHIYRKAQVRSQIQLVALLAARL